MGQQGENKTKLETHTHTTLQVSLQQNSGKYFSYSTAFLSFSFFIVNPFEFIRDPCTANRAF